MFATVPLGGWVIVGVLVAFVITAVRDVDRLFVVIIGMLPPGYFLLNLVIALVRQDLPASILLGVPLGESPVLLLVWTVATGLFVAVVLTWRFLIDRR